MFESIFDTISADATFTVEKLLLALGVALALGFLISVVYMKTHKTKTPSKSFALTLVVLPVIITVIILLVGNSVARAFSLAGAFSIIRFRSAPGDPKDITYVLFSMAVGLSCGMGYMLYGAIVAVFLCVVMVVLELTKFGQSKRTQKLLKITVPENLNYQGAFDGILQQYTDSFALTKVKTANLGSLYELQYKITSKDSMNEKSFIDDLRCRNGNLNITLVLDAQQSEF
ncbi:MAG: DUF4956 domain-containing protein [Oscillospiraceae bacterium]|jgi:membrane protein CcdC involved in cytochrome C biogenesis|nr:DUF4956 domain-containing protein [Oscillospiraceae bacterium]